jgi:threonine synthase
MHKPAVVYSQSHFTIFSFKKFPYCPPIASMFWTGVTSAFSGKSYPKDKYEYIADDESPLAVLSTTYDLPSIAASLPHSLRPATFGMFRYLPFLPISPDASLPSFMVGGTPLVPVPRRKSPFKFDLWIKDEGRNPTGSLKDRSSAVVCLKAIEFGRTTITTASSGNAAAATSAVACNLGLECIIFVPAAAPVAKIVQNRVYGSKVYLVDGEYDDAVAVCKAAAAKRGWYNRSTGYNPFTIDGKKTVSFEICEQFAGIQSGTGDVTGWGLLGKFAAPDVIVTPVGVGNILSGIHKGLVELFGAGLIEKLPRIIGAQAEGSNSLYVCWRDGADPTTIEPMVPFTCADSLSTAWPNDALRAIRAVRETNGAFVEVKDEQLLSAIPEMARASGVFTEPAGGVAWAGLKIAEAQGLVKPGEKVVLVNTGSGLKDIPAVLRAMESENIPTPIKSADEV